MINFEALRFSRNMKYIALYISMFFYETEEDIYIKKFDNDVELKIEADNQKFFINNNYVFPLDTHESFVKLECINRILELGYRLEDIKNLSNDNYIIFKDFKITFIAWNNTTNLSLLKNNEVFYKSRLVSGVIEYKSKIKKGSLYDYGLFENKTDSLNLIKAKKCRFKDKDFIFDENKIIKYIGKSKIVNIPYGIEEIESAAFWDNQYIEKVTFPETLKNYGGDTFYNCRNLKEVNIPSSVIQIGDNPFAGCINVTVNNFSKNFVFKNDALYSSDMKTLIYVSIIGAADKFEIPNGVKLIGKHAFYMCSRFKKIIIPKSVIRMKNNPFSGCEQLSIENHSSSYFIIDSVIYNKFKTQVIGVLNNIKTDELRLLESTKSINRNSFWNCKGIKKIILPKSLEDIGYNPFVGCSNIHFVSESNNFKVINNCLCSADGTTLICCPPWNAVGEVYLPESVIRLERGSFSGCDKISKIHLHNVNIIEKSCFTNCSSLTSLYCSDLMTYIGEWAFAYCNKLKEINVYKDTKIDNNALINCPANVIYREHHTNYVIESDNLYTLKSMLMMYQNKIDSILIDPPYNSNIDYIGYKDSEFEGGYYKFMFERLNLAKQLLSNDGFLVINIDENGFNTIKDILYKLFDSNLITVHKWKKKNKYFDQNRVVLNPSKKQTDYEFILICRASNKSSLKKIYQPYLNNDVLKEKKSIVPEIFDFFGTTSSAKDEIKEIFGTREYFSTPKPLKLMKELIRATTNKNSIVLDFFAGSGTVGHALESLNKEDKGKRTYILVSNNESDICRKVMVKRMQQINSDSVFLN